MAYEKRRDLDRAIAEWETIYELKPNFQDVAEKLSQYQDIRADDSVKDYLTTNQTSFHEICKSLIRLMKLQVREVEDIPNGCQIVAAEAESKWRNVRKLPRLVWFLRVTEPVNERVIRDLLEAMKNNNAPRGMLFTSSTFTRKAVELAETRPIDLLKKEKLQGYLKRVRQPQPK
jgi:hypothetical protein